MNWHLFNTIDILKHSTGDTVHLSVAPLLNLNVPPMVNNEQLPVENIPFPDVLSNECVTYGILDNTNIGYIYLAQEYPESTADIQFNTAIDSLKNTDALIIDMRLNFGGWALFENAFKILELLKTLTGVIQILLNFALQEIIPFLKYKDWHLPYTIGQLQYCLVLPALVWEI